MTSESAAGLTKTFGYDLAGRRTSIGLPTGGTQTFVYDERSLPIGSAGTAGTTTAKFNGDSQLTWRQR